LPIAPHPDARLVEDELPDPLGRRRAVRAAHRGEGARRGTPGLRGGGRVLRGHRRTLAMSPAGGLGRPRPRKPPEGWPRARARGDTPGGRGLGSRAGQPGSPGGGWPRSRSFPRGGVEESSGKAVQQEARKRPKNTRKLRGIKGENARAPEECMRRREECARARKMRVCARIMRARARRTRVRAHSSCAYAYLRAREECARTRKMRVRARIMRAGTRILRARAHSSCARAIIVRALACASRRRLSRLSIGHKTSDRAP